MKIILNRSQISPFFKFKADYYASHHLKACDILLVIEVAGTSLTYDREIKLPLYASAGIASYWIINLEEQQIEAHQQPSGHIYKTRHLIRDTDQLQISDFDILISANKLFV